MLIAPDGSFGPNLGNLCVIRSNATLQNISSSTKCALAVAFLLVVSLMQGQEARRVIYRTNPVYPPILKDKQIGGLVRILAVVTPAGAVKQTEGLGGNPVLVTASEAAVKQWKFQPAANETREIVTLRFDITNHHQTAGQILGPSNIPISLKTHFDCNGLSSTVTSSGVSIQTSSSLLRWPFRPPKQSPPKRIRHNSPRMKLIM